MDVKLTDITAYSDERGNRIVCPEGFKIPGPFVIRGSNNILTIEDGSRLQRLLGSFDGDNGGITIGANPKHGAPSFNIRCGQDSTVLIGMNVSTTSTAFISAVEGAKVTIGNDVMIASDNQFRADDAHPIFDVRTGARVNPARDIVVGDHVWVGFSATLMGGAHVGSGSVLGFRSLINGPIPNNVVAVGMPAKVVKRHIAWERPHLSLNSPPYKPNADAVTKSIQYWRLTEDAGASDSEVRVVARGRTMSLRMLAGRIVRKLGIRRR